MTGLYVVKYRLRDGQNRVWDQHSKHLSLEAAQDLADKLWNEGNETVIHVLDYPWSNAT